jgi:hypothetical protein
MRLSHRALVVGSFSHYALLTGGVVATVMACVVVFFVKEVGLPKLAIAEQLDTELTLRNHLSRLVGMLAVAIVAWEISGWVGWRSGGLTSSTSVLFVAVVVAAAVGYHAVRTVVEVAPEIGKGVADWRGATKRAAWWLVGRVGLLAVSVGFLAAALWLFTWK